MRHRSRHGSRTGEEEGGGRRRKRRKRIQTAKTIVNRRMKHKKYLRKQVEGEEGEGGRDSEELEDEEGEREARLHYIKKEDEIEGEREEQNNNHRGEAFLKGGRIL